ncbi:MAG TPA: efflux transporter outer membrane subunit [Anaeromyxobacteraceae bacterium]|nr:efflux transporter outer membrane subunit [Anaeromyxobacteraceae bacterium]
MSTSPKSERRRGASRRAGTPLPWLLAAGHLASCAVGPDFVRPEAPKVDRYEEGQDPESTVAAEGQAQRLERGAKVVGDWWRLFGSPQLDALMKDAARDNQTLQAALASLHASQANLRAGYGVFFPQADLDASATRQKATFVKFGETGAPASVFNLFSLSGTVTYVLDVFGGQRRAVESLQAQADYQKATAVATYLTLTGNVVNTVIAAAAYAEQARATEELVRDEKEQVSITEAQAEAGTVPWVNALSLRSQLDAAEATVPPLLQRQVQAEHLLATLAGHLPSEWTAPRVAFSDLKLPASLPVSLPSELVSQRPDVLAAEAQLHQASAEIGVATAALLPSITLTGSLGGNNTTLSSMFAPNGTFWSFGAGLTAPLFHGGTLLNKRQAAVDAHDQALASYRQTVLQAFTQVADALRALENDARALAAQARSAADAEEALRLVRVNYEAGTANYLQVLVAFTQYHQARINYIQARAQRLQDTVALFVALGGGWWDPEGSLLGAAQRSQGPAPGGAEGPPPGAAPGAP